MQQIFLHRRRKIFHGSLRRRRFRFIASWCCALEKNMKIRFINVKPDAYFACNAGVEKNIVIVFLQESSFYALHCAKCKISLLSTWIYGIVIFYFYRKILCQVSRLNLYDKNVTWKKTQFFHAKWFTYRRREGALRHKYSKELFIFWANITQMLSLFFLCDLYYTYV